MRDIGRFEERFLFQRSLQPAAMSLAVDVKDLFHCCKTGKSETVKRLIERGVSVNIRDRWDSTPLYYACLCGHFNVVELLLQSGASCNADTFDGERCLHGALTLDIRNLLKEFQVCSKNVLGRTPFHLFMTKLRKDLIYVDAFVTTSDGDKIPYHSCIASLSLKNLKIFEQISGREDFTAEHVSCILDFIYTAVVDIQPISNDLSSLETMSYALGVDELQTLVTYECNRRERKQGRFVKAAATLEGDFDNCIQRMTTLFATVTSGFLESPREAFHDIEITVGDQYPFYCHKCVLCIRSPYFQSFIEFAQNLNENSVQRIEIQGTKVASFYEVLHYIYTDSIYINDQTDAFDMLEAADMFLVPGMKHKVGRLLCNEFTVNNVVGLIRMSRHFGVEVIENQAVEFISNHLHEVLFTKEFKELVRDDASAIVDRQEVDSIDVVDAIRFHLYAKEDLDLVDSLLAELNLDA
ncbi:hypothetical protein L596_004625 [Steinernema carpocapsae]|uniref:BTB domain-containing protein n=2 Tax=Steinernema carpocapsae TaxID=34508 RepID=A0A4U8UZZ1_STECR|nr:hypothetical protein L596_004625 [Steinernema carpocapsae]